eukprot:CAMPEP_0194420044 /NCGR_PEP_ID=MMETSP0176-20130528/19265_1 /TAXON_ID=216777 /ORGANISM="Proboscia alata, Strain PI-D3" /LENGTH=318 /DNA_ID=CAMNT_0039227379 /DNA_START=62 /DNA_END=1015 /DNA_ORIENTATION=-
MTALSFPPPPPPFPPSMDDTALVNANATIGTNPISSPALPSVPDSNVVAIMPMAMPMPTTSTSNGISQTSTISKELLSSACTTLETRRCLHAEYEASLLFGSSLLQYPQGRGGSSDASASTQALPGGVRDAWNTLSKLSHLNAVVGSSSTHDSPEEDGTVVTPLPPLGKGQLGKIAYTNCLHTTLSKCRETCETLSKPGGTEQDVIRAATRQLADADQDGQTLDSVMGLFYERLTEVRDYHARHSDGQHSTASSGDGTNPALISLMMMDNDNNVPSHQGAGRNELHYEEAAALQVQQMNDYDGPALHKRMKLVHGNPN